MIMVPVFKTALIITVCQHLWWVSNQLIWIQARIGSPEKIAHLDLRESVMPNSSRIFYGDKIYITQTLEIFLLIFWSSEGTGQLVNKWCHHVISSVTGRMSWMWHIGVFCTFRVLPTTKSFKTPSSIYYQSGFPHSKIPTKVFKHD